MGATCISDFCENEEQNQKEKKEEYNLSLSNITNKKILIHQIKLIHY